MAFGERNADSADASHSWKPFIPAPAMFRDFRHTMSTAQITTYLTTHYCPTLRFSDEFRHTTDLGDFIHVEMSRCGCSALSPLMPFFSSTTSIVRQLLNRSLRRRVISTSRMPHTIWRRASPPSYRAGIAVKIPALRRWSLIRPERRRLKAAFHYRAGLRGVQNPAPPHRLQDNLCRYAGQHRNTRHEHEHTVPATTHRQ
jgi:hypothetical protein